MRVGADAVLQRRTLRIRGTDRLEFSGADVLTAAKDRAIAAVTEGSAHRAEVRNDAEAVFRSPETRQAQPSRDSLPVDASPRR